MNACGLQCGRQLGLRNNVLGVHDIDAMGERRSRKMRIEERHHAAHSADSNPYRQEFRTPGHQQADGIAFANAFAQGPARVAVSPRGKSAIGEALAGGEERGRVGVFMGELRDDQREDTGRMLGDWNRASQGAQSAAQRSRVRSQPLNELHAKPSRRPLSSGLRSAKLRLCGQY